MKKAAIGTLPPRAMFGDVGEVEHVMHLVRRYAGYAANLTPKEREHLRAQSVLISLDKKLREALDASEIEECRLNDYHGLLLWELRNACEEALGSARSSPAPSDWTTQKLDEFNLQLLRINAIEGDIARELVSVERQRRKVDGAKGADATKRGANLTHEGLDQEIARLLALGHDPLTYVDDLMAQTHTPRRTVYRRIALQQK